MGSLINAILNNQFTRTRDGDRLFYLSTAAGLYANGVLNPEIAAIIDLNTLRLSDIIEANSVATGLQENVFFVFREGDFDQNGVVDSGDLAQWQSDFGDGWQSDADWDGDVDGTDFLTWQRRLGFGTAAASLAANVPEPTGMFLLISALAAACSVQRSLRLCSQP